MGFRKNCYEWHMVYQSAVRDGVSVIRFAGEVDISCSEELDRLEDGLTEPECIVFDVSDLEYVDTTFLRFLLRLKNHANKQQQCSVTLLGMNEKLRRVLEATGLSSRFGSGDAA